MSSLTIEVLYCKEIPDGTPLEKRRRIPRDGYDQEVVSQHSLVSDFKRSPLDSRPVTIHFGQETMLNPDLCVQPASADFVRLTPRAAGGHNRGYLEADFIKGPEKPRDGLVTSSITRVEMHPLIPTSDPRIFTRRVYIDTQHQLSLRVTFKFFD